MRKSDLIFVVIHKDHLVECEKIKLKQNLK